jgi:hypothetical protein
MTATSKVGRKHFGRVSVQVSGKERWDGQNHSASWSDDGEVAAVINQSLGDIVKPIIAALEQVVARNASLGASEYLSSAESTLTLAPDGDVLIGVKIANDEATLIAYVPLKRLLVSALCEIRPTLGVDPQAQALLSQLMTLGQQLASLGRPANQQPHKEITHG